MQGSLTFRKFVKAPLIYSVSYFNLGVLEFFWVGWANQSTTVVTGLNSSRVSF